MIKSYGDSAVLEEFGSLLVVLEEGSLRRAAERLLENDSFTVRTMQNPLKSLADDVATTKRVIDAQKEDVILVGHPYGGAVI
jgi:hypothetical protein